MHLHAKRHRFDACDSVTEALTLVDTFYCESRLGCFLLPCIVESLIDLPIVNFSLKANSGLFSYWIKIAFIHGHTKPPNSLELSSYLPKEKKKTVSVRALSFCAIGINLEPISCISKLPF